MCARSSVRIEHRPSKPGVAGSSPAGRATICGLSRKTRFSSWRHTCSLSLRVRQKRRGQRRGTFWAWAVAWAFWRLRPSRAPGKSNGFRDANRARRRRAVRRAERMLRFRGCVVWIDRSAFRRATVRRREADRELKYGVPRQVLGEFATPRGKDKSSTVSTIVSLYVRVAVKQHEMLRFEVSELP
jgi:hypothetical protein